MIVTIQSISQEFTKTGKEYLKVIGVDSAGKQTTKTVFDNLADKWPLIKEGATLEFKMEQKGQFWNVIAINEIEVPPTQEPQVLPEQMQAPVDEALKAVPPKPLPEPNPQAVGMVTKELGDMIRAKYLVSIFGGEAQKELIKWYRSQVLGITRIPYDGEKLPKFGKVEPPKVEREIAEEDIPF